MKKNITEEEILLFLKYINKLIKNKEIKEAKKLLLKIDDNQFKGYMYIVKHLSAKIDELNKIEEEMIYLEYAKININKRRYENALSIYYEGLINTNKNIFNYYVGRALYKMGYQLEALPYLKKYVRYGGFKLSNALLLITIIYRNHNLKKEAKKYINKCEKINEFNDANYKLTDYDYQSGEYKLLKK